MSWTVEDLKPALARRVSLFERGILTEREAAAGIVDACDFTVLDQPQAWPEVTAAMAAIPVTLLTAVTSQLIAKQLSGGGWRWPPSGGIGTLGGVTPARHSRRHDKYQDAATDGVRHCGFSRHTVVAGVAGKLVFTFGPGSRRLQNGESSLPILPRRL